MINKFKSKKSKGLGTILVIVSFIVIFLSFGLPVILNQSVGSAELIIKTLISILIIGFFIWCWTSTYYVIDKTRLIASFGPFKFRIEIQDIKEIITGQKTINWIIKPTLSWNCIVIECIDYKTLAISPENEDIFIKTLTDINKEIKIKYSA